MTPIRHSSESQLSFEEKSALILAALKEAHAASRNPTLNEVHSLLSSGKAVRGQTPKPILEIEQAELKKILDGLHPKFLEKKPDPSKGEDVYVPRKEPLPERRRLE